MIPRCLPKHADGGEDGTAEKEEKEKSTPPITITAPMKSSTQANGTNGKENNDTEEAQTHAQDQGSTATAAAAGVETANGYNEQKLPNEDKGEEWILLDSLVGAGIVVPDLPTMFSNFKYPFYLLVSLFFYFSFVLCLMLEFYFIILLLLHFIFDCM